MKIEMKTKGQMQKNDNEKKWPKYNDNESNERKARISYA